MKQTLSTSHAASLLAQDTNANWSYAGATALVEYLEEYEESTGEEMEFDVVAIRCDWSEHDSLQGWANDYFNAPADDLGWDQDTHNDDKNESIRNYIQDNGHLIEFNGGIIVSSF